MTRTKLWPDLSEAWRSTEVTNTGSGQAAPGAPGGFRFQVLKTESRARVLLLESGGCHPSVLKMYRTPPRLAWRTFGLASRANREFTVMMNAHRLGLPIARPRYWLEHRSRGCLEFSAIALDVVHGPDMESWLLGG